MPPTHALVEDEEAASLSGSGAIWKRKGGCLPLVGRYALMIVTVLASLCVAAITAFAQSGTPVEIKKPVPTDTSGAVQTSEVQTPVSLVYRHTFFVTWSFGEDINQGGSIFLGGSYRFTVWPAQDLGLLLAFSGRIDAAFTLEQIRPRFFLQREESARLLISLSVDKVFNIVEWFGAYAGAGAGYSWGSYAGTTVDPESTWTAVLDVGLTGRFTVSSGGVVVRLGYQYADRVTTKPNTGYIAVGFGL